MTTAIMKKRTPLLSVIVPVYGTEDTLERCLDSILGSTYKNIEIIVVNDKSPGNASEIVNSYHNRDNRVNLVEHPVNKGLFLARMTGTKAAHGDYLAFLDSDDYVSVDFYRRLIEKAVKTDSDMVIGEVYLQYKDRFTYYNLSHVRLLDIDVQKDVASRLLFEQEGRDFTLHILPNKVYRKDLWEKCTPYFELETKHLIMCEDVLFSSVLFYFAEHITNIHGDFIYYVKSDDSSTGLGGSATKFKKNIHDIFLVFDLLKTIFVDTLQDKTYWKNITAWEELLLSGWIRSIQFTKISKLEKKELVEMIKSRLTDHSLSFQPENGFFYSCTTDTTQILGENIKKEIVSANHKIVSFDIFDTLVYRPFWSPTDIFYLLGLYAEDILGVNDLLDFKTLRIEAEKKAREINHVKNPAREDITLDEIYDVLKIQLDASSKQIQEIKNKEIALELQYCKPRKYAQELFQMALSIGKEVIITSDMYLPRNVIEKILKNCGYEGYSNLYLSNEVGLTKSTGRLFAYLAKDLKQRPQQILHIGDNEQADISMAKKAGLHAFHFPKAVDRFMNHVPGLYSGELFQKIYQGPFALRDGYQFDRFFGWKTLLAIVANHIFDNPFVIFHPDTDFNADPRVIGYFALGLHMFGVSTWLAEAVKREGYENLNFMARDGYLPMECYKVINKIYQNQAKIHYLYLTRSVMLPLQIQNQNDFYGLLKNVNIFSQSPRTIVEMVAPILNESADVILTRACRQSQCREDINFSSIDSFYHFINVLRKDVLDDAKSKVYKEKIFQYLKPAFKGKTATFDVGYSCRVESMLKKSFAFDVTPYYVHINNQLAYTRSLRTDVQVHTFYSYSPGVTGVIRELMISKQAPSCQYLEIENGKVKPIFKPYHSDYQENYIVSILQNNALQLIKDVVETFRTDIQFLACQHEDISLALEYYMSMPKETDKKIFSFCNFEDDLGLGKPVSIYDFWSNQIANVTDHSFYSVDLSLHWLHHRWQKVICLYFLNRDYLKDKVKETLKENHPLALQCLRNGYKFCRKIYRAIR